MRAWGILLAGSRAFLPQLPRPLQRAAIGGARAPALLVAEEFDRALELPGLQLEPRVHLGVDGAEHRLRHAVADHGHAMTAHQDATASAQRARQRLPERPVARSEERRVGKEWRSRWSSYDERNKEHDMMARRR